ncbi:1,2-phenylacetyl-CoA epoxidase subunit PaaD [Alicyclobacillus sp. TC]|uniref:1,2-phenylacetyl-CoA epoxidase subunit PaaD n=1 Tax=Alicyclobacillus sp. TC TaxID=2606450 RepID=UPI001932D9A6|nr:1,2-phenylacetyl-CoA epoxidase subunit PaaD [Alicyclobacillus sp. TC]
MDAVLGNNHSQAVWKHLENIADPELPAVSLVDLGIVHRVETEENRVKVELLPTFIGCPALSVIADVVARELRSLDGVESVDVQFVYDTLWTSERLTERGKLALKRYGIAPPSLAQPVCPYCDSVETELTSRFGPAPCRMVAYCHHCQQPFEVFKTL